MKNITVESTTNRYQRKQTDITNLNQTTETQNDKRGHETTRGKLAARLKIATAKYKKFKKWKMEDHQDLLEQIEEKVRMDEKPMSAE